MSKDNLLKEYEQIKKTAGSKIDDNHHNKKILRFIEIGKSRFSLDDFKHELESLKSDLGKSSTTKKPEVRISEVYKEKPKEKATSNVCPHKECVKSDACTILEITGKIPKSFDCCSYSKSKDQQTKKENKLLKQKEVVHKKKPKKV
jgi:hypothetical protein